MVPGTYFIPKLLIASANLLYPSKHRLPTVHLLAVQILETMRDFVTRTPF
jgi:hypothetical protein